MITSFVSMVGAMDTSERCSASFTIRRWSPFPRKLREKVCVRACWRLALLLCAWSFGNEWLSQQSWRLVDSLLMSQQSCMLCVIFYPYTSKQEKKYLLYLLRACDFLPIYLQTREKVSYYIYWVCCACDFFTHIPPNKRKSMIIICYMLYVICYMLYVICYMLCAL